MRILWFGRNNDMSPGDHSYEMTVFDALDDTAMELLMSGQVPPGRDDLSAVAEFAVALMDAAATSPRPSAELAALFADGLSPAEDDDVTSTASASRQPKRKKTSVLETALAKLASLGFAAKASVTIAGLLAATTGVAAAGALPDPAQEAAADVISAVSPFEVPRPDQEPPDDASHAENGDPEANDHGQTVSDTARTTDAEGCEKGYEVAETAGGDPAECGDRADAGTAEAHAAPEAEGAADNGQEHRDAAADASPQGQDDGAEMPAEADHRDQHGDDAGQHGTDAAEAGADNAGVEADNAPDSRP